MDGTNPDAKRELDWDLHIDLAEQGTHKVIRVTSNETIGTVMVKLTAKLGNNFDSVVDTSNVARFSRTHNHDNYYMHCRQC